MPQMADTINISVVRKIRNIGLWYGKILFIAVFCKENDNQETDNCMECDYELCRGAQPEQQDIK